MTYLATLSISLVSFAAALAIGSVARRTTSFAFLEKRTDRYGAIDGLRGYLAIGVLFHHYVVTWYWKTDGKWRRPPETLFQNYGKVGVAIFFMITGFLFVARILGSENIEWFKFYKSRLFRIFPLYLFAVTAVLFIVFLQSNFQLVSKPEDFALQLFRWASFHGGTINEFDETRFVIAGVDWTLKYEWFFYLALPAVAYALNKSPRLAGLALLAASLWLFVKPLEIYDLQTNYLLLFAVGGATAYFNHRVELPKQVVNTKKVSFLSLTFLAGSMAYPTTLDLTHVGLLAVFFLLVASGNNLFGILSLKSSILLGEVSYSIYLLHGVFLYIGFSLLELAPLSAFSLIEFLLLMPIVTMTVVVVSTFTYLLIEKPAMSMANKRGNARSVKSATAKLSRASV